MKILTANDAKYGVGQLIDLARKPATMAKHGHPVVVVIAVEEYERMKALDAPAAVRAPKWKANSNHGPKKIRTLLLPLVQLRRAARRHGCLAVQGLCPRFPVHQIHQRPLRRRALRPDQYPGGASFKDMVALKGKPDIHIIRLYQSAARQTTRLPRYLPKLESRPTEPLLIG
jgi:hypothetical protein